MARELQNYRTTVRRELGFPDVSVITDDELDEYINDSYFDVLRRFDHKEIQASNSITTTSGTRAYALQTDYWWMELVKDDDNQQILTYKDLKWIELQDTSVEGMSLYWTTWEGEIILYPTPDTSSLTIDYWYYNRPSVLSADDDADVLPREWEEIIKEGAVWRCFKALGEYDRRVDSQNIQRSLIASMISTATQDDSTGTDIATPQRSHEGSA